MLKAMSKFQGVLKMFMLGMLKTILKTVLKYEKNTITFMACVEIEQQISFFSFGFACVTEVRHIRITFTRMHSSRMRTTRSLTVSHRKNHAHPQEQPCTHTHPEQPHTPPGATTHAPPRATMHAPRSNHAHP